MHNQKNQNAYADLSYPKISYFSLLSFCCYVIIWYLQVGKRIGFFDRMRIEFLWAIFLTVMFFVTKENTDRDNPLLTAIILYFVTLVIQIIFSHDINLSWNVFFERIFKFSFMCWFIIAYVKSPRDLLFFIGAFLLACGKMGQEGLYGTITGSLMWENQGVMRLHGTTPLYIHPNSFSGMALGTIPFIGYLFLISNKKIRIILIGLLGLSLNIILFTGSRTGYVAFILMGLAFYLKSKSKVKMGILGILVVFAIISFIPEQYIGRFKSIGEDSEIGVGSKGKRIEILIDAVEIFAEYPLGVGVGAFPVVRMKKYGRFQDTHNLYLEIATNLGVQGLVVFSILIVKMLKLLNSIGKKIEKDIAEIQNKLNKLEKLPKDDILNKHKEDLKFMNAICKGVFMFIVVRLALGLFGMDLYEIYWWFAIGLTVALYRMSKIAIKKTDHLIKLV